MNNEKMNTCIQVRKDIEDLIKMIDQFCFQIDAANCEEHIVEHNIVESWREYRYVLNGIMIRWDECVVLLKEIINWFDGIDIFKNGKSDDASFFVTLPQGDKLSYRFEDFMTAVGKMGEKVFLEEIARPMPRRLRKKMLGCIYNRDDVDGLYWRINLLRNRSAHSPKVGFTENEGRAARYLFFDSRPRIIYTDTEVRIETMLVDLTKSEYIKEIIKTKIIDGGLDTSVMDLLFSQNSPKGHGKKSPQVLFPEGFPFFDLNTGFLTLSFDIMELLKRQLIVINEAVKESVPGNQL